MGALLPAKRGPKGPHNVTAAVHELVVSNGSLSAPALVGLIAERTGCGCRWRMLAVSATTPCRWPGSKELPAHSEPVGEPVVVEPNELPEGVGALDHVDAETAAVEPLSFDPPVRLPDRVVGRYMGLGLYYPAITALGPVLCCPVGVPVAALRTVRGARGDALAAVHDVAAQRPRWNPRSICADGSSVPSSGRAGYRR
jgi:hypothetical protein